MTSKKCGEAAEAAILAVLLFKGYAVSIPFGNTQRYDVIVDDGSCLLRAQCKLGHYAHGVVSFSVANKNGQQRKRRTYHGDIDVFLVYCPELNKVYRVPIVATGVNEMRLRVDPLQRKWKNPADRFHWACNFEI